MQPAGGFGIGDGFADGDGEGDDVVADFGFDFEDVGDVDAGAFAEAGGGFARDDAGFRENVSGGKFDVEPLLEFVFVAPEKAHLGARVAIDQNSSPGGASEVCRPEGRRYTDADVRNPGNAMVRGNSQGHDTENAASPESELAEVEK